MTDAGGNDVIDALAHGELEVPGQIPITSNVTLVATATC